MAADKKQIREMEKKCDPSLLKAVPLAWPTIILALSTVGLWGGVIAGVMLGWIPMWLGIFLNTILAFVTFTPMHDAGHRSITRKGKVEAVIGRFAGVPLGFPFAAFRYLHLEHHKHTNHGENDPDMWSGRGPWWALPFRWATQDFYYYFLYAKAGKSRPIVERIESWFVIVAWSCLWIYLGIQGEGIELMLLWLLPSRLALVMLTFAFNYLPHHPHRVRAKENRFDATRVIDHAWLSPFFLYQNYHLIHHLYPAVPFYRYLKVWRNREKPLMARGARVTHWWGAKGSGGES